MICEKETFLAEFEDGIIRNITAKQAFDEVSKGKSLNVHFMGIWKKVLSITENKDVTPVEIQFSRFTHPHTLSKDCGIITEVERPSIYSGTIPMKYKEVRNVSEIECNDYIFLNKNSIWFEKFEFEKSIVSKIKKSTKQTMYSIEIEPVESNHFTFDTTSLIELSDGMLVSGL